MFLDNINNFNEVNHKDENPANNNVENLEWCTHKYNMNYGTIRERISIHSLGKIVLQYSKNLDLLNQYCSIREASRISKVSVSGISGCCNDKLKTAGGYIWKFKED